MKAKLLTLAAAVLLSTVTMAQFHLGVKGGANIIKVDGKSFKDEFRYGYHLGGFMEIRAGNKLVFQPEVLFNQYSTTIDSNFSHIYQVNSNAQTDVKLSYLSIPLLLNYKLIGSFISLQAGPQFGMCRFDSTSEPEIVARRNPRRPEAKDASDQGNCA